MIELLSVKELLLIPPPTWMIDGFLEKNSIACLYGQSGHGKSFIALDWALCVATGKPWLDTIPVVQGPVIYIAAEGGRSIQKRVRAWMHYYKIRDLEAAQFSIKPLYVRDADEQAEFIQALVNQDIFPSLVVIDTLSQSFGTGDENSMDMQEFVGAITDLRNERHSAFLIVHHTNATGKRERGHTSLRAGMDHMFETKALVDENHRLLQVTLENNKQKDSETAEQILFTPHQVKGSLVLQIGVYEDLNSPTVRRAIEREESRVRIDELMDDPALSTMAQRVRVLAKREGITEKTAEKRIQRYLKDFV